MRLEKYVALGQGGAGSSGLSDCASVARVHPSWDPGESAVTLENREMHQFSSKSCMTIGLWSDRTSDLWQTREFEKVLNFLEMKNE